MVENELIKHVQNFIRAADLIYSTNDYTSATILYFKAMFAVSDYVIFSRTGKIAKDHTERFKLLSTYFPDLYKELDFSFKYYQDTYSKTIKKEICDHIKESLDEAIKKYRVKIQG